MIVLPSGIHCTRHGNKNTIKHLRGVGLELAVAICSLIGGRLLKLVGDT
jgi:hypothetical protein